jgi:hypothetical protein
VLVAAATPTATAVAEQRQRVEERLRTLRGAVQTELGWAPRTARWVLPVAAAALGLALGAAVRRRLRG